MAAPSFAARTLVAAAKRRHATSSGAPVASGYEPTLRPIRVRVQLDVSESPIYSGGDR
jgi:hypothetical protein